MSCALPGEIEIDTDAATALSAVSMDAGDLLVWTVYRNPSDHPDSFICRPHSSRYARPLDQYLAADTLDALRQKLPPGLACLDRVPEDPPVIVETWI